MVCDARVILLCVYSRHVLDSIQFAFRICALYTLSAASDFLWNHQRNSKFTFSILIRISFLLNFDFRPISRCDHDSDSIRSHC